MKNSPDSSGMVADWVGGRPMGLPAAQASHHNNG